MELTGAERGIDSGKAEEMEKGVLFT